MDSPMPGEPLPINEVFNNKRRLQETDSLVMNKRRKLNTPARSEQIKDFAKSFDEDSKTEDLSRALTVKSSVTSTAYTGVEEGVNFLSSNLCPSRFKPGGGKYKYKKGYSFTRILSSPTSYVVLWKNANILQRFLNEGSRLKERSESELEELRMFLIRRKLDLVNLSKYPEGALRVFFFLLRNQEAPLALGKEELLDFCSKWNCKKKHYWCFSETRRLRGIAISNSKFEKSSQQHSNIHHAGEALSTLGSELFTVRIGSEDAIIKSTTEDMIVAATEEEKAREETSLPVKAELSDAGELLNLRSTSTERGNRYTELKEADNNCALEEPSDNLAQATYSTLFGEEYPTFVQEDRCSSGADALQCASNLTNTQFHKNNDISSEIGEKTSQVVDGEGTVHNLVSESIDGTGVTNHIMLQRDHVQLDSGQSLQATKENFIYTVREQGVPDEPAIVTTYGDLVHPVGYCDRLVLKQSQEMGYEKVPGQQSVIPYNQCLSDGEEGKSTLDASSERRELVLYDKEASQKTMRTDACWCDSCTVDPTFCYGCQCSLCRVEISPKQNWSFLHCPGCNHVCHVECALKARRAGVVKEMGLDGEFLCPSCLRKRDLIPFWKDRVKNALMSVDTSMLEKQLFSAVLVLNGTQREMYQNIHEKLRELHSSVLYDKTSPDLTERLYQIQKDVDALDDPNEQIDDFEEISEELLRNFQVGDLLVEESKVLECKKKAELDHAEWLQAETLTDSERLKLKDAIEQVKKIEEETKLRADCARASKRHLQRAERRLQFLKSNCKARVLSREQIEIQRAALNTELSELRRLQGKIGSFSYESPDLSVDDFSLLLDGVKVQRKRVESAQAMLEHLLALDNIFK
ncbi:hypothetical protein O6H91_09G051300 [Diphasiastrum complanatum]|uniref:Uncharacterized protein n=1 Tax=Diphasiastrum complanatum TaxID=34168 RepID=A0ACC2CP74_DIPCM|nr:hypothetical protein O6H91_09G051300 [Diphasiastrum complanatum]